VKNHGRIRRRSVRVRSGADTTGKRPGPLRPISSTASFATRHQPVRRLNRGQQSPLRRAVCCRLGRVAFRKLAQSVDLAPTRPSLPRPVQLPRTPVPTARVQRVQRILHGRRRHSTVPDRLCEERVTVTVIGASWFGGVRRRSRWRKSGMRRRVLQCRPSSSRSLSAGRYRGGTCLCGALFRFIRGGAVRNDVVRDRLWFVVDVVAVRWPTQPINGASGQYGGAVGADLDAPDDGDGYGRLHRDA